MELMMFPWLEKLILELVYMEMKVWELYNLAILH